MSIIVLVAVLAAEPRAWTPLPQPSPMATEQGDPVLATQLAERARSASDLRDRLRLLIAASVVAPERVEHRLAVAAAVLDSVQPRRVNGGPLGGGGLVRYGALSADGAWLVIDREQRGQVWQLFATEHVLRLSSDLDTGVVHASAGTQPVETRILIANHDGVDLWDAVSTFSRGITRNQGRITGAADAVAVSYNGETAVTVAGTTATVWDLRVGDARAITSVLYDRAVTSVELPPSNDLIVAAGHADGSVAVDRVDVDRNTTQRRVLTGADGPVGAVAVSADGATAVVVGGNGTLTAWRTTLDRPGPAATVAAAGSARVGSGGAYRVRLSPAGTYALVAGQAEPVAVWSLVDPSHPVKLHDVGVGANPAVPAMFTYDGRRIVTIDRDSMLTVWDNAPVVDTLADPLPRACEAAGLTEQAWRQIVPDPGYANPCPSSPGLPTVNVQTSPPGTN